MHSYVTEPSHLTARDIHALETLAQNGRWEISVSANSLSLPGEALCVVSDPGINLCPTAVEERR
jgi:hypothetical protein